MERTILVHGIRVHCLLEGDGHRPVVVLLHGWTMNSSVYKQLGHLLAERFFVVIPDLPGFGKSDKTSPTFEEFAALLNTFLEKIGVSKATFVAHSMGGGVAIEVARLFPERVTRLVLVDSIGERIDRSVFELLIAAMRKTVRGLAIKPAAAAKVVATAILSCLKRPAWALKTANMIRSCDLVGELRQIKVPTFVVWAKDDELLPSCARICSALSAEPIIVDGVGHDWIILDQEEASRVIGELI